MIFKLKLTIGFDNKESYKVRLRLCCRSCISVCRTLNERTRYVCLFARMNERQNLQMITRQALSFCQGEPRF